MYFVPNWSSSSIDVIFYWILSFFLLKIGLGEIIGQEKMFGRKTILVRKKIWWETFLLGIFFGQKHFLLPK